MSGPPPLETLTFRLEHEDGTVTTETVPLDFDDIPAPVLARIIITADLTDVLDVTAHVWSYRLNVPLEAARSLVDELQRGEGVISG